MKAAALLLLMFFYSHILFAKQYTVLQLHPPSAAYFLYQHKATVFINPARVIS